MMPDLVGFLVVVMIAYVIPGPDFFIILQSSASGRRAGLSTAIGAQTGLAVHMLLAVFGLSALLAKSAMAFSIVKAAGAVYLIWLGIRIIWSSRKGRVQSDGDDQSRKSGNDRPDETATGLRDGFLRGLLTNLLNPKAVVFFLSVIPQFVDPSGSAVDQILLLGTVDIVIGVLWWCALVLLLQKFASLLKRTTVRRWWDRATGSLLATAGAVLGYTVATSKAI